MSVLQYEDVELVLKNSERWVSILVTDLPGPTGNPEDASELTLAIRDTADNTLIVDTYGQPNSQIVRTGTGDYRYPFGSGTPSANVTGTAQDYLFQWSGVGPVGTEPFAEVQVVKVVSATTWRLVKYFRNYIDKTRKAVSIDPTDPCYLGYTDAQLIQWLEGGLHAINAYQPYPCWTSLDNFPCNVYQQILLDSALLVGVTAQELFAIDTDIPNYSDQGNAFVIQHQPALAAFLTRLAAQLDKQIPLFKRHFVSTGAVHVESSPNFKLQQLIAAAPYGAVFRNVFFST